MYKESNMDVFSDFDHRLTDEALCKLAAGGDRIAEETLVMRYQRFVRACARPYFLAGGDTEDLLQEGMLGLLTAIREYDEQRGAAFSTYAAACIRSRLFSALKMASRKKHAPLNQAMSLDSSFSDGGGEETEGRPSVLPQTSGPEDLFLDREAYEERIERLKAGLSSMETGILPLYLRGLSYGEIAAVIGKPSKSVDNAVQRIRKKAAQIFSNGVTSES